MHIALALKFKLLWVKYNEILCSALILKTEIIDNTLKYIKHYNIDV